MRIPVLALLISFFPGFLGLSGGQELPASEYAPILVPIKINGPIHGGFGTIWSTSVTAYNSSSEPVPYFGKSCVLGVICPRHLIWPARSYGNPIDYSGHAGYILWVERSAIRDIHLSVRLNEITRGLEPVAEIPIIREAELYTDSLQILDVPIRADARVLLRLYSIPRPHHTVSFVVTAYDRNDVVLGARRISVKPITESTPLPIFPGYGEMDLWADFPDARTSAVRLEIRAEEPDTLFWAFISLTDNGSQRVRLINPS